MAYGYRIDTLFDFCQLEIKIDCPYTGNMGDHFGNESRTYSSLLEQFDFYSSTFHTNIISSNNKNVDITMKQKSDEFMKSQDFLRKRTETRNLIIKIQS